MISDLVYPSDIVKHHECCANRKEDNDSVNSDTVCNCGIPTWTYCPHPPAQCCPKPPKPTNYPPYPPYGYPCVPPTEPTPLDTNSVELQICKLSKKSAAIKKMIENFTEKNKDTIIKIGEASYNFGSYKTITKDEQGQKVEENSIYGETILQMLTDELAAIKEKMKELTEELDKEDDTSTLLSTEKTVTQLY